MFKNFDDVQKFSKDQMDVAPKAATTVSEGVKALATEATEFSKKSFEDLTATSEALRGAKTFEAAVKIQQDYAKSAYEAFVAQATNTHLALADQLLVLGVLLFTSKGSGGVAGAGFVTLAATLASMDKIPVAGLTLLLGVDRFINEARAVTNLIGNGIATITVAQWEGAFDEKRATAVLDGRVHDPAIDL